MNAPKSMGEYIGTVAKVRKLDRSTIEISIKAASQNLVLNNGDGFAFSGKKGVIGFRGDVCEDFSIRCKATAEGIAPGTRLFRNINAAFEKELERNMPKREIGVELEVNISGSFKIDIKARSEDGREILSSFNCDSDSAENRERQEALIREQLSKRAGHYIFRLSSLNVSSAGGKLPLLSVSILNSMRRLVASDIDALQCRSIPLARGEKDAGVMLPERELSYKYNIANEKARAIYLSRGAEKVSPAYELSHVRDAELMRTKYCIRYELGMCPVHQAAGPCKDLFLVNNGRRLALHFDCKACEMTVVEDN